MSKCRGATRPSAHLTCRVLRMAARDLPGDKAVLQEEMMQLRLCPGDTPPAHKLVRAAALPAILLTLWRLARRDAMPVPRP